MKSLLISSLLTFFLSVALSSTTLAQVEVRGAVEGEWTLEDSPYLVVGDITLDQGRTLTIEPGVQVLFNENAMFTVRGRLNAVGTEEDSIYFAWRVNNRRWHGLRMFSASNESRISYCVFLGSTSTGGDWQQESSRGGALYLRNTNIEVSHCLFTLNFATGEGAGIHAYESSPLIIFNIFDNNSCYNAAAIALHFSNATVTDNLMINGVASCAAGGIMLRFSNPTIERNIIMYNNSDLQWGCGIYLNDRSSPVIRNNVIVHNDGGAMFAGPNMDIRNFDNNTIAFNTGRCGILLYSNTSLTLRNCILWRNGDEEIWCHVNSVARASYCDILNVDNDDIQQGEGVIDTDPMFVNAEEGDFRLSVNSPCIDAGDPEFERDADGSIADIGALAYDFGEDNAEMLYEPHEISADEGGDYVINVINIGEIDLIFHCILVCDWATVDPLHCVVEPEGDQDLFITINPEDLHPGRYETILRLVTNVRDQRYFEIPITLFYEMNQPPSFQNLPAHLECGETETLNLVVRAVDPGEDEVQLTFVSEDLPQAAQFEDHGDGTGTLQWETARGDAGDYTATFSVSDGEFEVSAEVEIEVLDLISINLLAGWNLISSIAPPRDPDQETVWREIVDRHNLIIIKDQDGRFYAPGFGVNGMPDWEVRQGYEVRLTERDTLTIFGEPVDPQTVIPLTEAWSYVAYFPQQTQTAPDAFTNIQGNLVLAKDDMARFYAPAYGFCNMAPLRRGKGYKVNVAEDCDLVWNDPEDGRRLAADIPEDDPYQPMLPTSKNMSVLVLLTSEFEPGDLIEACDVSGALIGKGVIGKDGRCGLAVWGDEPSTLEREGLAEGEAFSLEMDLTEMDRKNRIEILDILEGEGLIYRTNAFTVVEVGLTAEIPAEYFLAEAYPNPFNPTTRLTFGLPEGGRIKLAVYDLSGRLVEVVLNGELSIGIHTVHWSAEGLPSGVYLARLECGGQVVTKKLMLVR